MTFLIIKPLKPPLQLRQLEAMKTRLPKGHKLHQDIDDQISARTAGYKGEKSLDYHLGSFKSSKKHHIFYDLRMKLNGLIFQMDMLILSPNYALILESKNMKGRLKFEPHYKQLLQTVGEDTLCYPCPIEQLQFHKFQLSNFFRFKNLERNIPIIGFVVLTNGKCIIESDSIDKKVEDIVIRGKNIFDKIYMLDNYYANERLSNNRFDSVSNMIQQSSEPWTPTYDNHSYTISDITCGARCLNCQLTPMLKKRASWICPQCNKVDHQAHIEALIDYALLISPTITTKEYSRFLQIPLRTSLYQLKKLHLPQIGSARKLKYDLRPLLLN